MTTIYQFDTSSLRGTILICTVIMGILIGVGIAVVILPFFRGWKDERGHRLAYKETPISYKLIFQGVPALIILVGCLGLGNLIRGYAGYEIDMMAGKAQTWSGDPRLVTYEESWYRDSFLGYKVTLVLDGEEFVPSNNFSMEMVELFESDTPLTIHYGYMGGNELFIWQITTQENQQQE